jgi:hypothetical protein
VAGKLGSRDRRRLGAALCALGALTTIPAAFLLFGRRAPADPLEAAV